MATNVTERWTGGRLCSRRSVATMAAWQQKKKQLNGSRIARTEEGERKRARKGRGPSLEVEDCCMTTRIQTVEPGHWESSTKLLGLYR